MWQHLKSPSSTPGRNRYVPYRVFCRKFNSQELLFDAFFDIIGNFGRVEP